MSLISPLKSTMFAKGSEFYEISDQYDQGVTGFAGDYEYYGFLNTSGCWIIQRHQVTTGAWLYTQGRTDYTTAWSNKAGLSYGLLTTLTTLI